MANATFWDKAAKKYAASPIKDIPAYEATLDRARHYLRADDHLLEIGCGTGTTALTLSDSVGRIAATDVSAKMLAIAEGKQADQGITNVTFLQAEVMKPLADAPFDAICAFSILHLVDDLPETLMHLREQLKPGGYVISKTACLRDMNRFIRVMVKVMKLFGKAPDVLIFSAGELERAFKRTGFEVIEAGYFGKNKYARFVVARRPA
ncbi:class I SAM-dependent methyltransferase [Yoonia sp. F2084L]|uniref:class I SAM-dependent methyltransferase n=1 Tax=Yoonia sp. F2084L TaxID=2926419 RepID=UPI001FF6888C|nr:class I SAM-dependent methyltransferase [Yoonia sp. F2084L]MCK0096600.1 class I SAM-dependent methyltransferase [Yoonia sp. F2084L]